MALPTATFSFEIGGATDGSASAEIDTRSAEDGGDNARRLGRTSNFQPGDLIAFLVYFDHDKYDIDHINTSVSEITGASVSIGTSSNGVVNITQKEGVIFSQRGESKQLGKKAIANTFTAKNIGNNPLTHFGDGNAALQDDLLTFAMSEVKTSEQILPTDTDALKAAKLKVIRKPTVYELEYKTKARLCRIQTPSRATILGDTVNFSTVAPWSIHVAIYLKEI